MSSITIVLRFSWNYLRRYWGRVVASVVFGIIFALANASFIWAARTLTGRFDPSPGAVVRPASPARSFFSRQLSQGKKVAEQLEQRIDPWLPRAGQPVKWRQVVGGLLFLPLLVAIRAMSDYLNNYCMGWVSERVIRDMRLDLMSQLSKLSLDFFSRFKTGDLLTRINLDTQNLLRCLRVGGADLVKESLTVIAVLAGLCLQDWKLTLWAMVLLPCCLFPLMVLGRKARRATRAGLLANVSQSSQLVELLGGIRVVKAFGLENEQLVRFRKTSGQIVHAGMKGVQAKELVNPILEIISVLGLGLLLLYVFKSGRTGRDLATFLTGVVFFFQPIKKLAGLHILFEQVGVGVGRLQEILSEQPSVQEPAQPKPLPGFHDQIRFENVTFGFGDKIVLR